MTFNVVFIYFFRYLNFFSRDLLLHVSIFAWSVYFDTIDCPASGAGILISEDATELLDYIDNQGQVHVIQKYLEKPLLLEPGHRKFDIRQVLCFNCSKVHLSSPPPSITETFQCPSNYPPGAGCWWTISTTSTCIARGCCGRPRSHTTALTSRTWQAIWPTTASRKTTRRIMDATRRATRCSLMNSDSTFSTLTVLCWRPPSYLRLSRSSSKS